MRYKVAGTSRELGHEMSMVVEAPNRESAREQGRRRGMAVGSVEAQISELEDKTSPGMEYIPSPEPRWQSPAADLIRAGWYFAIGFWLWFMVLSATLSLIGALIYYGNGYAR